MYKGRNGVHTRVLSADRNVQGAALCMSTAARGSGGISLQAGHQSSGGACSAHGARSILCDRSVLANLRRADALAAGSSAASYCPWNNTVLSCCPKCPRAASTGRAGGRPFASASACASAAAVCWATLPAIPACTRRTSVTRSASPRKRLGPRGGGPRAGSRR